MGRSLILACCCAACSFQLPPPGSGGDDSGVPMPGDRDGDGVPDESDLCPDLADKDQRDYDRDGFGDACDKCPHIATAANVDGDIDGVGDECDPAPDAAGDSIALWVDFKGDPAAIAGWTQSGSWTVDGEFLSGADLDAIDLVRIPLDLPRASMATRMRIDTAGGGGAGVWVRSGVQGEIEQSNGQQAYQCGLIIASGNVEAKTITNGTNLDDNTITWPGPLADGTTIDIAMRVTDMLECTLSPPATSPPPAGVGTSTAGKLEILTARTRASFDYLFVVRSGS